MWCSCTSVTSTTHWGLLGETRTKQLLYTIVGTWCVCVYVCVYGWVGGVFRDDLLYVIVGVCYVNGPKLHVCLENY